MAERTRLEIVDDPVVRASSAPSPARRQPRRRSSPSDTPMLPVEAQETQPQADSKQPAPKTAPPVAEPVPPPAAAPQSFRREEKRAVFGRVPRSLSRRLERAVVELREDMEDLTQEQVLAALLSRHVNPAEPDSLAALTETVHAYRDQL
jgi:hypothetical protein